jgi:hypothetical protein
MSLVDESRSDEVTNEQVKRKSKESQRKAREGMTAVDELLSSELIDEQVIYELKKGQNESLKTRTDSNRHSPIPLDIPLATMG